MPLIKMERYALQKRIEIVKINYQNAWKWTWISQKIIMTDEADFHLGSYVNKPYFFENEAGVAVSVNGLRYRTMINEFLWLELEDMDVDDVYFQQNRTTCYTSGETIGLLREKFPGRVISRNCDCNWPPKSCALAPVDFFLGLRER